MSNIVSVDFSKQQQKILRNPRLFAEQWLRVQGLTISPSGDLLKNGQPAKVSTTTAWLDYLEQVTAYNCNAKANKGESISKFRDRDLQSALDELIECKKQAAREETAKSFVCKEEDLTQLRTFLKAATGDCKDVDLKVLAHWCWMVKRKLMGKHVYNHIMPVLYGKQGSGKTEAINQLIAPLRDYLLKLKMNQVGDERYAFAMSDNLIVFFDEMQGASRTDVDSLKNIITTDTVSARRLFTTQIITVTQSCSFIGATNRPVSEQLYDTTGMRRFYEMRTLDKLDWDLVNSIDYLALWLGIDENKPKGYLPDVVDEVRAHQEELTQQDSLDLFFEDYNLDPTLVTEDDHVEVGTDYVFIIYKQWCEQNGFKQANIAWFGRQLKNKGFEKVRVKRGDTRKNYYLVNKGHELVIGAARGGRF